MASNSVQAEPFLSWNKSIYSQALDLLQLQLQFSDPSKKSPFPYDGVKQKEQRRERTNTNLLQVRSYIRKPSTNNEVAPYSYCTPVTRLRFASDPVPWNSNVGIGYFSSYRAGPVEIMPGRLPIQHQRPMQSDLVIYFAPRCLVKLT